MRVSIIVLLTLLSVLKCEASGGAEGNFVCTVSGVEDGLPQNVVTAVLQTEGGDIWCGTHNGLARFDGVKFTVFDLQSVPPISAKGALILYEDTRKTLWVGMDNGNVMRVVDRTPAPTPKPAFSGVGSVMGFGEDASGDLWVLWQDRTLARWRDGMIIRLGDEIDPSEAEIALVRDGDGRLWLTHRLGFSEVTGNGLVPADTGIPENGGNFHRATAAREGGLWIASEKRLRRWYQGKWDEGVVPFLWDEVMKDDFVTTLNELRDGRLLVGLIDGGVLVGRPGGDFERIASDQGLPHVWIKSAMEDHEGTLWLGTGGGLVSLKPRRVKMIELNTGKSHYSIQSLYPAEDGSLWIATEGGGLYRIQDGGMERFSQASGLETDFIWSVTGGRSGRIWAGTWDKGLYMRENGGMFVPVHDWSHASRHVTVLNAKENGVLWAGGPGELARMDADGWRWRDNDGKPFSPPGQRVVANDPDGSLWIGLEDGRVVNRNDGVSTTYDKSHGMPGFPISCIVPDKNGVIWIGTVGGGLVRLKDGRAFRYTKENGLPHNVVSQLIKDDKGFLWLGTYGGLCRLNPAELNSYAEGTSINIGTLKLVRSDGLPTLEINTGGQPGACADKDGNLIFPTNQGIAIVRPSEMKRNLLAPPVVMESITADGHTIPMDGAHKFGPAVVSITFSYTALSFVAPDQIRFRTRLEGLEKTWQEGVRERSANYRYLPPGNYVFHVIASNNDGIWNERGTRFAFTILPYFWQTSWFRIASWFASALLVGGLVWLAARRRSVARMESIERAHALERERARIARDIHDDLGSGLTRIMLLSQSAQGELEHDSPASAEIEKISLAAEGLSRSMDEVVWAVDPRQDTLEGLVGYITTTAQDMLKTAGIRFRFEAPSLLPLWPLSAESRHGLFLAFKEALHNIVRHASAETVRVIFRMELSSFSLTIEDDGKGFDPDIPGSRSGGGHGLRNMRERLAEMEGTCEIQKIPDGGTRVVFSIPGGKGSVSLK